jgi:Flp pilus assembly protein TadB
MQFALLSSPRLSVHTVAPLSSVSAAALENPIEALVQRLEAMSEVGASTGPSSADAAPRTSLSTADAAAIIALPLGVGFGLYAVVVTVSDPLTAAVWAVAATIAAIMVMRYGDTNRAMKVLAAWIAKIDENDTNQ